MPRSRASLTDRAYIDSVRSAAADESFVGDLHGRALAAALRVYGAMWSDPNCDIDQCLSDLTGLMKEVSECGVRLERRTRPEQWRPVS